MVRAAAPAVRDWTQKRPSRESQETLAGKRRAGCVAARALEPLPIRGRCWRAGRDSTALPDDVKELVASHGDELRAQVAEGVAAKERGELRDSDEAIAAVRRRIDERRRSRE